MDAWPIVRIDRESLVITPHLCAWNCWGARTQMGWVDPRYSIWPPMTTRLVRAYSPMTLSIPIPCTHACPWLWSFWAGILACTIYEACALSARIAPKIRTLHQRAGAPCLFFSTFSFGSRISWHHMPRRTEHLLTLSALSLSQRRTTHTLFVRMIPSCHLRSFRSVLCTMFMVWGYLGLKGWGRILPNQGEKAYIYVCWNCRSTLHSMFMAWGCLVLRWWIRT